MKVPDSWFEAVAQIARRDPDRIAISDGDESLTYKALVTRAVALASWLHERGLRAGDRLGIHVRKCLEENIATLAANRLGVVFVHIHPQYTVSQVGSIIVDAGIRLLITEPRAAAELSNDPALREALGDRRPEIVTLGDAAPTSGLSWPSLEDAKEPPVGPPGADQLATLIYTSGSTGLPKGVMHSNRNLVAFAANVAEYLHVDATDRVLGLLPVSFSYGLNQLLTTLSVGGQLVLQKAPFPADVVRNLAAKRITGFAAVPSLWSQILDYLDEVPTNLPDLRYVTNAGDALSEKNARRLRRHLPHADIICMYGSTEALRTSYLPPDLVDAKTGSIGKAIPNVEVFVIGDDGRICGPGEQGELVQRGAQISQGYWNNPEETSRRFHHCAALAHLPGSAENVYHSGDLVRIDEDGLLWFVSRADWMIKSGGFRFSIEYVERLLAQSGLVGDAAAFSLPHESMGQIVNAAVTRKAGVALDTKELERYCFKAMPSHMIPRAFHVVDRIPLLANGKRDREALRRQVVPPTSQPQVSRPSGDSPASGTC